MPGRKPGVKFGGSKKGHKPTQRRRGEEPILAPGLVAELAKGIEESKERRPKMSTARMAVVSALWHTGFSYTEITAQTGLSGQEIRAALAKGNRYYVLQKRLAAIVMRVESEMIPLAVDHLIQTLSSTDKADDARKDTIALQALSGRGVFRAHRAVDEQAERPSQMNFQVNFSAQKDGTGVPQAQIVGASRSLLIKAEMPPTSDELAETQAAMMQSLKAERAHEPREAVPADFVD